MLKSIVDHHVVPELTFKDKTPQGVEHVCLHEHPKILGCKLRIGVAKFDFGGATATSKQYEVSPLTPPREGSGDGHHAITDLDGMIRYDKWDEDIPSEGRKAKINRKCHVLFFAWTGRLA